jgi:glutaryl-CoA dehydrogenase
MTPFGCRNDPTRVRTHRVEQETAADARELLGGKGILLDHNGGRFVADAETTYSYKGPREMNTIIVGRALTGQSAFV